MNAKEELSQYKYKLKKVNEALEEYQKYKDRATKMTSIISDNPQMRSNLNSDKVGNNSVKMADLSREYEERWLAAEKERLDLTDKINMIEEPYRTLLHMRYIEKLTFEKIAYEMGYTYSAITKMHGKALNLFVQKCAKK